MKGALPTPPPMAGVAGGPMYTCMGHFMSLAKEADLAQGRVELRPMFQDGIVLSNSGDGRLTGDPDVMELAESRMTEQQREAIKGLERARSN